MKLKVHFAKVPPIDLGSPAPGIRSVGQETTDFAIDIPSEPNSWTTGEPIKQLVSTMAKIAGDGKPVEPFSVSRRWSGNKVAILMNLTPEPNGPRLWTDPFWVKRELFEDWWKRNIMPDAPTSSVH